MTEKQELDAFIGKLLSLNVTLKQLFESGNVRLFTQLNEVIKQMHAVQHGSEVPALLAVDDDCKIIYRNFDMIIAVLRSTEEGVIDAGAQGALNKLLHNIHQASVNIATALHLL